ncbi:hypothetical protein HG535_0C06110 [Zygotorulaspora mrakii]|uniref:DNA polymerase epsilon subunit B n=1 Tax=Zygotorulaspora mrakii TaxID=42260 RepID=A0A7H9B1G4_ZYGMR|nr:uncharacterized protein HG535_0C06110 [Zygotorulaspora mrakii]QLG72256.1 hypothetical protein HG535_0C06110 [Zygotorulaspora mrakii]
MFSSGNVLPVKIQPPLLRPLAYRVLSKKYGLNIKSDGLTALAEFVGKSFGMQWKLNNVTLQFLEKFAVVWRQQERGVFIDEQGVKDVITEMREREKVNSATTAATAGNGAGALEESSKKQKQSTLDKLLGRETQEDSAEQDTEQYAGQNLAAVSPISASVSVIDDAEERETTAEEEEDQLDWKDYFKIINASEQPKYTYDPVKLQFVFSSIASDDTEKAMQKFKLPDIEFKISLYATRLYLVRDRVLRNENFQKSDDFNPLSSIVAMKEDLTSTGSLPKLFTSMSITQIKNLAGRDGQNFLLLGLLAQNARGNWSLEDPSGTVEIDISQAVPTNGLYYVPGCIVLVEGLYFTVGNRFHVSAMTHPPGEKRETTLEAIGNLDLLGIHSSSSSNFVPRLDADLKVRLHLLERELVEHKFTFLGGDIFLDEMSTFAALRKALMIFENDPPTVIVFYGSFSAVPVHASMSSKNVSSTTQYKKNFDRLADLFAEFENVSQNSTLIFVPGINDPWGSMVSLGAAYSWPLQPLSPEFIQRMRKVCKNVILASNPTRIAYLSQEIVIVRDDMTDRFKRHSVPFPVIEATEQESELDAMKVEDARSQEKISISQLVKHRDQLPARIKESRKLVKTILDQGQISPFISNIRPIVWNLDQALSLCPIPSTLVICDTSAPPFDLTYNGCKSINAGKFVVGKKARYVEYRPSLKKTQQEEIIF